MRQLTCDRCHQTPSMPGRRFRCVTCRRLTCARCCQRGGHGQTGAHRWAECFDCEKARHPRATK